jgi:hypothetical protein
MTERLSTSHMLIVIEKSQTTFAAISSSVTIGGGIVNWDRVITKEIEGCWFEWVTRVNSTNVQDEGLRIGGIGHRMNSKVKISQKIENKHGGQLGLISIYP